MTATTPDSSGTRQTKEKAKPKTVVENRQARHLYFINETLTAGLVLEGWEVKAILAGQASFNGGGAYVKIENGEAFLDALTITPLAQARKGLLDELDPGRRRKLLLKRSELSKLGKHVVQKGHTVVPLSMTYNGKLKLEIGVATGKKLADKRETLKQRDLARDMARGAR